MYREENEHLEHVCMRTNLVTEPGTACQGNPSCIENYAGRHLWHTIQQTYHFLVKPISVESNLI